MVVALESLRENAVNLFHSGILFIFSMKNLIINGIQAFELLFFTRTMNAHLLNAYEMAS